MPSNVFDDEERMDWTDHLMEEDEIISHLTSLREMTEAGKMTWEPLSYDPPYFFIHNPFVEDKEASISQRMLVEGRTAGGRSFRYRIWETIHVPSGLCDIEIEEKLPETTYETALSFDRRYEYITSQSEILDTYKDHPVTLFVQTVVGQLHSANFQQVIKEPRTFSAEQLPAGLAKLSLVQKARKLFDSRDAMAFHALALSNDLRTGLGLKD